MKLHSSNRFLACLMALVMAITVFAGAIPAISMAVETDNVDTSDAMQGTTFEAAESTVKQVNRKQIVTIMVEVDGDPAFKRAGSVKGAANYEAEMLKLQNGVIASIENLVGKKIDILHQHTLLFNGFSFKGEYGWIKKINESVSGARAFLPMEWSVPETISAADVATRTIGSSQTGADDAWSAGYNGAGTAVAILDTGLVIGHKAFAVSPTGTPKYTQSSISTIVSQGKLNANTTAANLYYSAKIPFRYNYNTNTNDVLNTGAGYHGTHVAGIVAGNPSAGTIKGIAYNAQLVIMQVFNTDGGASWDTILPALEDCAYLGVDAANMSLGSDCGFTAYYDPSYATTFELLRQAGVNLAVAAGNAGTDAITGNAWGGYQLSMNPDFGIVGSPSTWPESLSVAACNSSGVPTDFSSWGTTSDLKLKPEIMAPGYSIYSSYGSGTSSYSSLSGTSMACPHVAGGMALITKYVEDKFPSLSAEEKLNMVDNLLISTATPTAKSTNLYYSPRLQGSGVMSLDKAITANAYISCDYNVRPLMEIGDDKTKSGVYTIEFDVTNFGTSSQTYTISANVQTETMSSKSVSSSNISASSINYINGTPYNLTSNATVSTNFTNNQVTVAAGATEHVVMTITLNSTAKAYLDKFECGMYVEGFIKLTNSSSSGTSLGAPYLSFYGDWNYPATMDHGYYWMKALGQDCYQSNNKLNTIGYLNGSTVYGLGINPYVDMQDWLPDRSSISPNGDGKYDSVNVAYVGVIRNSINAYYRLYTEDMSEYDSLLEWNFENKSYYYQTGTYSYTYLQCGVDYCEFPEWDGGSSITDSDGNTVNLNHTYSNGDTAVIAIGMELDYNGFTHEANQGSLWKTPVTIDTEAPSVVSMRKDGNTLYVTLTDNHYAAYAAIYSGSSYTSSTLLDSAGIFEQTRGAQTTVALDTNGNNTVYLLIGDYACNELKQTIDVTAVGSEPIAVTGVTIPETLALNLNETGTLTATITPSDANDYAVAWSSSNTSVATVDNGNVTAKAYGTATITCTVTDNVSGSTFTDTCEVTVAPVNVTGITVSPATVEVLVDETATLTATVAPANASDATIAWTTSNASVATVSNGVVTGIKAGTAVITATVTDNLNGGTFSASCTVNVTEFEGYLVADQFEDGGEYIIVATDAYAVSNNTVGTTGYYLSPVSVTISGDECQVASSVNVNEILWKAEGNTTDGFTLKSLDDGNYMTLNSSQYLYPGTNAITWKYDGTDLANSADSEGYYYLSYSDASTSYPQRFTTSKNTGNSIKIYKKITSSAPVETYYTVTFKDWDGTVLSTQSVLEGTAATAPADPTREGYTFTGWDKAFDNVTADMTVTAQYTINTYTVTFVDHDGTVLDTQTVNYGEAATAPADPTREGYTFTGWDKAFDNVAADMTVTAQYTINTYTVTFVDHDGTVLDTQTVNYGEAATAPAAPAREGYTFTGWDKAFDNVTADMTVTAQYTINTYTVTFVDHDGTVLDTQTVNYGEAATAPAAPAREGYTFTGWDKAFDNVTADMTVTAQYTINTYTVTFVDHDGTVLDTQTVNYGEAATAPAAPAREGYHFVAWDAAFDNITADTTVTAQYTAAPIIKMLGASYRTTPNKGIRFGGQLDKNFDTNYITITKIGMLIIPENVLNGAELTVDTSKVLNVNITSFITNNDEMYQFVVTLTNLSDSLLDRRIAARAYVEYTFNGEVYRLYSDTVIRSYNELAQQ